MSDMVNITSLMAIMPDGDCEFVSQGIVNAILKESGRLRQKVECVLRSGAYRVESDTDRTIVAVDMLGRRFVAYTNDSAIAENTEAYLMQGLKK